MHKKAIYYRNIFLTNSTDANFIQQGPDRTIEYYFVV